VREGDLALYWSKWGPMKPQSESQPDGMCTLIQFDDEEWKMVKRKPPNPKWQILFEGRLLWVNQYQVREVISEGR
jgi:hypothetical protein